MYGIGYISPSVNDSLLDNSRTRLGAPGDVYLVTDNRVRAKKEPEDIKAFKNFYFDKPTGVKFLKSNGDFDFTTPLTSDGKYSFVELKERYDDRWQDLLNDYLHSKYGNLVGRSKIKPLLEKDGYWQQLKAEYKKDKEFVDSLGKPTIKFEFEDNAALADFLTKTKGNVDYAETVDADTYSNPMTVNNRRKARKAAQQKALTDTTTNYLPPSDGTPSLPPSPTSPKALPPYNPQKEKYLKAKAQYPDAIIIFYYFRVGVSLCDDATLVSKALNLPINNGLVPFTQINGGFDAVKKAAEKLQSLGYNVVVVDQYFKTLLSLKHTTPDVVVPITPTNPNSFDTPDWDAIWKRMYDSYHWNSFDPENAANYSVKEFKNNYAWAVERLPEDRKKDFTDKFVSYIYEIALLNAAAPSAAVTGRGGISAKQAAKYNAANDRYMEKRAKFSDWIKNYVDRANRIEEREIKAAMSSEQKFDARFEEIKKNIDYLAQLLQYRGQVPSYRITNARQNLQSKIENEASKGNVDLVERLLDYMKPLNVYTNRSSIWTLADRARKRVAQNQAQEAQFEEQNADETSGYQVEFDTNEDRVKIYFDSIPSEQIRTWLKQHNFRWSPRNSAWQRQITVDSRYVINKFNSLMKDGTLSGLGKPTIKLEFEDNADLMSLFDTDGINGLTVNDRPAAVFNCPESQLDTRGYRPTYRRLANYDHLVDPADGCKTLKGYGFEKSTLDELINACKCYPQVARLAAHLKDPAGDPLQSAFNIWHWLHTNVRYDYDKPGEEEIRTPARSYADRHSGIDCDCLAVLTACLLINQGYHPCFEIVGFNNEPQYSHIYVNLDGAAIDRVLPVFLARPQGITKTKIMEIPVYALSGVGGCDTLSGVYSNTLAKIYNGTATGEDNNDFRKTQVLVTLRGIDQAAYKLAALLMPYVTTVGDDGAYYFDNKSISDLAARFGKELTDLQTSNATDAQINLWLNQVANELAAAANVATVDTEDTIVVIINPKGDLTRIVGNMQRTDIPTLSDRTHNAVATSSPYLATNTPAVTQTTPRPAVAPEGDPEDGNNGWWKYALAAVAGLGIGAMVGGNKKTNKRR